MEPWLLLQIGDSAFPTGGFAHSSGLEAAVQLGEVTKDEAGLRAFCEAFLWQTGFSTLPFVAKSHVSPAEIEQHDALSHAFLSNHVANRASRAQGRAFIATAARVFANADVAHLDEAVRGKKVHGHHAPLYGAALARLGATREETVGLFLHQGLRGVLSAAVRLGVVGPHEAQRVHQGFAPLLTQVAADCGALSPDEVAHVAPVIDLHSALHDRLYARLFQS